MAIISLFIINWLAVEVLNFRGADSLTHTVVKLSIQYNVIAYEKKGETWEGELNFFVKIHSLDVTRDTFTGEWRRKAIIPSPEIAEERHLHILEGFDLYLYPGSYELEVRLESGEKSSTIRKDFVVPYIPPNKLALSDIALSTDINPEGGHEFSYHGIQVIPNPEHTFGLNRPTLYFYFEIYNLKKGDYTIDYAILDATGSQIRTFAPETSEAIAPDTILALRGAGFDIADLSPGEYQLQVRVIQATDTATMNVPFYIIAEEKPPITEEFTSEEKQYYHLIKYVATPEELATYRALPEDKKEEFLKHFWAAKGKDLLHVLIKRIKYVDANFSVGKRLGRDTDRGKVYIKYGEPDDIERQPSSLTGYPYEKWIYYVKGRKIFIFVDKRGYGDYELVYSNSPDFPSASDWERWIPWDIIEPEMPEH